MPRQSSPMYEITMFRRGVLHLQATGNAILEHLTDDNGVEVIASCPPELITWLHETSSRLPANDDAEAWADLITIRSDSSRVTKKEMAEPEAADERRWRIGLMAFRRILC